MRTLTPWQGRVHAPSRPANRAGKRAPQRPQTRDVRYPGLEQAATREWIMRWVKRLARDVSPEGDGADRSPPAPSPSASSLKEHAR